MKRFLALAIFLVSAGLATRPAFADTLGNCSLDPIDNDNDTFIVTEGPESSADHGGNRCNLHPFSLVYVGPGENTKYQLQDPETNQKFPMSDRVDITNNHITMISDPRGPEHGLAETPNRITVPEVDLGGGLGFGADLGTGLIAFQTCTGKKPDLTCTDTPVDLIVISDTGSEPPPTTTPEPGSIALFGTGLLSMAGFLRRKLRAK